MGFIRRLLGLKPAPCRHEPGKGYYGGAPYGTLAYQATDGLRHVHMGVKVRCRHCGEDFVVARFHTSEAVLDALDEGRRKRRAAAAAKA
jgi:hypothetical protein